MKIFFVAAEMKIKSKPDWLDGFRKKYDEPHPYHITLKYPNVVQDDQVDEVKNKFFEITKDTKKMELEFSDIRYGETDNGLLIMLDTPTPKKIAEIQKKICVEMGKFGKTFKPSYLEYESNFKPHITIARHLTKKVYENAKIEVVEPVVVATVERLVLTIVPEMDISLMEKQENRFVVNLQ